MKIIRGIGKVVKPFVNAPGWVGWDQIKSNGKTIKETAKSFTAIPKAQRKETFEEAIARMQLTEKDLQQRLQYFKKMCFFYCIAALVLFIYCLVLLFTSHFAAALLSAVLTCLALTLAFRQNFWYFQIKQRKLGCTIQDWFKTTFRGQGRG